MPFSNLFRLGFCYASVASIFLQKIEPGPGLPLLTFVKIKFEGNCGSIPWNGALTVHLKCFRAWSPPLPLEQASDLSSSCRWRNTVAQDPYMGRCAGWFASFFFCFKQSKMNIWGLQSAHRLCWWSPSWWRSLPSLLRSPLPRNPLGELNPAFYITSRARFLLIHVFLPFVVYGKKGRMNGRSLIGAADDAYPGPLWRGPFGKKTGEAAYRGSPWLTLALVQGPAEQVCYLCTASVSVTLLCLSWTEPGKWGPHVLLSGAAWAKPAALGSWSRNSHNTRLALDVGPLCCRFLTTMEKLGKNILGIFIYLASIL